MAVNATCVICGAVEDLAEDEDLRGRRVWVCNFGKCAQEWEREMRDEEEAAYQADLDDLNTRYGRY